MGLRAVDGQLLAVLQRVAVLGCSAELLGDTPSQSSRAPRLQASMLLGSTLGPPAGWPALSSSASCYQPRPVQTPRPHSPSYASDGPSLPVSPWARPHG